MHASPLTIAVGCFAAGSLAAVGIANAVSAPQKIPDSTTGVITACYKKSGGNVRFINAEAGKKCKSGEKKVKFNQTGPQGAQGTQGVQGERGPSNAFVKTRTDPKTLDEAPIFPLANNNVVSLNLEAGKYVVSAHAVAKGTNVDTVSITCSLSAPADTVTATNSRERVAENEDHSFAVNGTYSNTEAGTVTLICVPRDAALFTTNGAGEAASATITATKVADLAVQ